MLLKQKNVKISKAFILETLHLPDEEIGLTAYTNYVQKNFKKFSNIKRLGALKKEREVALDTWTLHN